MVVTWLTFNETISSEVNFGISPKLNLSAFGSETLFTDNGSQRKKRYVHRATLTNLSPKTVYYYRCGSKYGWSDLFYFRTFPDDPTWQPRIVLYGDLGNVNAQSLPRLQNETEEGNIDVILHVGDFAYDMNTNQGNFADEFLRQIEPIAAYVPYMTNPGNHESAYNFSHYRNSFSMPGDSEGLFYSYNVGPLHIIGLSTEVYFYYKYDGIEPLISQWKWLQKDLYEANLPENRELRPWIMVLGHRPMYCSNTDFDDCTKKYPEVRTGIEGMFGLEDLFYKYGVDLMVWAHEHSYERLWPIYNMTVCNGSSTDPYTNPRAPVHIITGSAGCQERHSPFKPTVAPWSAFRSLDYGYTKLNVINKSLLHIEQVSVDKDGEVIDAISIEKDAHGPESFSCT